MHVWLYVYAGFEDADAAAAEEDEPQDNDDVVTLLVLLKSSPRPRAPRLGLQVATVHPSL